MTDKEENIYFESTGSGKPVLFIHGLGSSTKDWEFQTAYFSKSHKTIAIDLRGHGKSGSYQGTYSIKLFAKDVARILEKENKPATVVGISMGGMVAFQLVLDYPHLVDKLVIINSFVEMPMNVKANRKALRIRKLIPRIIGMKAMGRIIAKKVFPYKHQKDLRKLMIKRWAQNNIKDYIKSVDAMAGWTVKERLSEIKCPVLIVGSEFDYISNEEKENYTRLIPNAKRVIISDAHHAVTVEKPDELNKIITEFLEEK